MLDHNRADGSVKILGNHYISSLTETQSKLGFNARIARPCILVLYKHVQDQRCPGKPGQATTQTITDDTRQPQDSRQTQTSPDNQQPATKSTKLHKNCKTNARTIVVRLLTFYLLIDVTEGACIM